MYMTFIKMKKAIQLGWPSKTNKDWRHLFFIPPQTDIHTNFKKELGAFGASGFWCNGVNTAIGCFN